MKYFLFICLFCCSVPVEPNNNSSVASRSGSSDPSLPPEQSNVSNCSSGIYWQVLTTDAGSGSQLQPVLCNESLPIIDQGDPYKHYDPDPLEVNEIQLGVEKKQ